MLGKCSLEFELCDIEFASHTRFVVQPAISTEFFCGEVWGVVWVEMGVNPVRPQSDPTRSHNLREKGHRPRNVFGFRYSPSPLIDSAAW